MLTKEELLAQLRADRHVLLETIDDVPDDILNTPGAVESWSVIDLLAHITARDGEMLRRIAFVTREISRPPHDVSDEAYWSAWTEEQVKMKRIMGPRGVKVDMAGTWVRLLTQIEALSPPDFANWLEFDPQWRERPDLEYAERLRVWGDQWERSLPWWQRLRRKIKRLMK